MKRKIITILLVITAVLFAGCTGQDEPVVPEQVPQTITHVSMSSGTAAMTQVPHPVTTVQVTTTENPVKVFNGKYNWVEYRENSSVTMPPNPRSSWIYDIKMERTEENYLGSPAVHEKFTILSDYPELSNNSVTITKDGSIEITDIYFHRSTNKYLSGKWSRRVKGVEQTPEDYSDFYSRHNQEDNPSGWLGIEPFCEPNTTLTGMRTESITVPSGTYTDVRVYSGKFRDGTPITLWVAPDVPVPVRYEIPNKNLDGEDPLQLFELKGWG
ncbi:MAG: hypothetical protein Q7T80_16265 [Methanoregula sp.]|nr:hypothetical protein [Methanoregula sp.]